jgi:nitric oxide reductase NorD protein
MSTSSLPDTRISLPPSVDPALAAVVRNACADAARLLTPAGMKAYLNGVGRLKAEGVGWAPIVAYLEQTPAVVEELGEAIIAETIKTAIGIHARTDKAIVDEFFATAPLAARHLGEAGIFIEYLQLLQELAALAPHVLAPLLDQLPTLLEHLTISGLKRWAILGVQSHARDREAQRKYFALESSDAVAVLKLEGEGTLFTQVQRRLHLYLRALWGHDVIMRPKAGKGDRLERHRPFLDAGAVYLPDACKAPPQATSVELYRAAAAHAAAHLAFTKQRFKVGNYKPIKLVIVSLLEDARVEQLAIDSFPGLRALWRTFHRATPAMGGTFEALAARLSRSLIDPDYADDSPWVKRGREMFAAARGRLDDQAVCIELASALANDIGQMRLQFNFKTYVVEPAYRDDHSFLWDYGDAQTPPPNLDEDDEIILEEIKTNPQESPQDQQETELKDAQIQEPDRDQKDKESPHAIALELVVRSVNYGEWDYLIGRERPAWCTVFEKQAVPADASLVEDILRKDDALVNRVKTLIRNAQIQRAVRLRKQYEGDRIDLDQAIRAVIDLRSGHQPDPRINMRTARRGRDLSVLVLMDLSNSTGDMIHSAGTTVLNLAREAIVLLAEAMHELGDQFAIHGFTSNGRRDVTYYRFKDFDQEYGGQVKSLLAGATPQLSTRMGAAIRHAGQLLRVQSSEKKLLLVITDGEPSDVDVFDPQYLMFDAKKAVEGLTRYGVQPFCMSLDPKADKYVSRIFGGKNYLVVDRLASLPEKLPLIYMRLTHC